MSTHSTSWSLPTSERFYKSINGSRNNRIQILNRRNPLKRRVKFFKYLFSFILTMNDERFFLFYDYKFFAIIYVHFFTVTLAYCVYFLYVYTWYLTVLRGILIPFSTVVTLDSMGELFSPATTPWLFKRKSQQLRFLKFTQWRINIVKTLATNLHHKRAKSLTVYLLFTQHFLFLYSLNETVSSVIWNSGYSLIRLKNTANIFIAVWVEIRVVQHSTQFESF